MPVGKIRPMSILGGMFLSIFFVHEAFAHDLHLFAAVEGKNITGYTYYHGDVRVPDVEIKVYAPQEKLLGQITTDDNGEFKFALSYKCEHTVVAVSLDGHRATSVIKAEDLPDDLPAYHASTVEAYPEAKTPKANLTLSETQLKIIVDEAVAKQVRPLREQLERYENKVRLRDIVGGIGFIVGLAGVSFYFAGKRKN